MKKHLPWIIGTIAFGIIALLAAIGVAYFGIKSSIESAKPAVPMADLDNPMEQVTFDDDYNLKILNIGETSIMDGSEKVISSGWSPTFKGTGSSSSRNMLDIRASIHFYEDETIGAKFEGRQGDLLIELQVCTDMEDPVRKTDTIRSGSLANSSNHEKYDFISHTHYLEGHLQQSVNPSVILQLQDRTGGWITARGPYGEDDDKKCRVAVAFEAWPRDLKTLHFRAVRFGSEPKYFQLENPSYVDPVTVKPLQTQQLPIVHKDPDYTVTLNKITECYHPELGRFVQPKVTKTSRFHENKHTWRSQAIYINFSHAEDPLGGTHYSDYYSNKSISPKYSATTFPFPAHIKQAKLIYTVSKGSAYPRKLSDAIILAEAEVSKDGKSLTLTKSPSAYGINSITFSDIDTNSDGEKHTSIKYSGVWRTHAEEARAQAAGINGEAHLVGFVDGSQLSTGSAEESGSSSSGGGGRTEFDFSHEWYHKFKPGQKIIFALCKPLPDQQVTFTVDLPKAREVVDSSTETTEDS